jgi:hypothetical protein
MQYGIDQTIQSGAGFKSIGVGIQENCEMTKVVFGPSSERKEDSPKALSFHFKQDGGGTFRHFEFPIDNDREKKNAEAYYDRLVKAGKTPDQVKPLFVQTYIKRVYTDQASRIKHIMSKFIPEAQCLISGVSTFEAFSNAVVKTLGSSYEGVKLRLKLIYNSKDYSTFPRWADFVEVQTDAPTTLRINPKKERIEKQVPDSASGDTEDSEY